MNDFDEGQRAERTATRLDRPLLCWHESLYSARTDPMVALSEHGGFILTDRPLPEGARVFLELHLGHASNAARGEIDGCVVADRHLDGDDQGFQIEFVGLDDAIRLWIRRHLQVDPFGMSSTDEFTTQQLAEAQQVRREVPEGFQIPPSVEGEPTRSVEGLAFEPPQTLEYGDSQAFSAAAALETAEEKLSTSPSGSSPEQVSDASSADRQAAVPGEHLRAARSRTAGPASIQFENDALSQHPPPPASPDDAPAATVPISTTNTRADLENQASPAVDPIEVAVAERARENDAPILSTAPVPADRPWPTISGKQGAHASIEPPAISQPASSLSARSKAAPLAAFETMPDNGQLSESTDPIAHPPNVAPDPMDLPPTDPGEELPSLAVDVSDEEATHTETHGVGQNLEEALFGDLSAEADQGRASPLASLMEQPTELDGPAHTTADREIEAAVSSADAGYLHQQLQGTPGQASSSPPSATNTPATIPTEVRSAFPATATPSAEVVGAPIAEPFVEELLEEEIIEAEIPIDEMPSSMPDTNPTHIAHDPFTTPESLPSTSPSAPALPAEASLSSTSFSSAVQHTQPFGVDVSEIDQHLARQPPAAPMVPKTSATPPLGTPSPLPSVAEPAPVDVPPEWPPVSPPAAATQTLQFSAAAVQAELQQAQLGTRDSPSLVNAPIQNDEHTLTPTGQASPPAPQGTAHPHAPAAALPRAAMMMEPEEVVEVNTTSQLVRVATDEHGDIQSIQSIVGPMVTAPAIDTLQLDGLDVQDASLENLPAAATPDPFDEWAILENKVEDDLPVVVGATPVAGAEPWVIKPDQDK